MASAFRLQKWYVDAIAEDGRTFIGYVAHLRWWLVSIHYFGTLYLDEHLHVHHVNRFRKVAAPLHQNNELRWKVPGFEGTWHRNEKAIGRQLLSSKQGNIFWNCLMPRAAVRLRCAGCHVRRGHRRLRRIHTGL